MNLNAESFQDESNCNNLTFLTVPRDSYILPTFVTVPLPLLISDLLKLEFEKPFNHYSFHGKFFKRVLVFGCAFQIKPGISCQLDDGTGTIDVVYKPKNPQSLAAKQKMLYELDNQIDDLKLNNTDRPSTSNENESLKGTLHQLVYVIKRRVKKNTNVLLKKSCKIAVVGAPYKSRRDSVTRLLAFHIAEFEDSNVDFEINFKRNLIQIYFNNFQT